MRKVHRFASFSVRKVESHVVCVRLRFTHNVRKIQLYTLKRCDNVLYSYYKKKYCSPRAKSLRLRDCPKLGPVAPTLMRVDHSMFKNAR